MSDECQKCRIRELEEKVETLEEACDHWHMTSKNLEYTLSTKIELINKLMRGKRDPNKLYA